MKIGSIKGTAAAYDSLSQIELREGGLQTAIKYLYDEEKLLLKINDLNALQICLGNQGAPLGNPTFFCPVKRQTHEFKFNNGINGFGCQYFSRNNFV